MMEPTIASHSVYGAVSGISFPDDSRIAPRDLADVAALLQLDDVFGDGIVEPEITIADRLRQQRRLERFPQRSEIEQRVGGDRPVASAVGPAVIEEQAPPFDAQSHGDATGTVGRYDRRDVSRDDPLRVTDASPIWSQPRCACASLGASSFAGYVRSLKRDDGNCMAEVLLRPRGVRPQRPGNRVSSRPPILSDAASPVAVLFQTIPNFIQPGPGAVVIQFSSRGATCANRSNRLIPELDHNSTAKEHDVRQLR